MLFAGACVGGESRPSTPLAPVGRQGSDPVLPSQIVAAARPANGVFATRMEYEDAGKPALSRIWADAGSGRVRVALYDSGQCVRGQIIDSKLTVTTVDLGGKPSSHRVTDAASPPPGAAVGYAIPAFAALQDGRNIWVEGASNGSEVVLRTDAGSAVEAELVVDAGTLLPLRYTEIRDGRSRSFAFRDTHLLPASEADDLFNVGALARAPCP